MFLFFSDLSFIISYSSSFLYLSHPVYYKQFVVELTNNELYEDKFLGKGDKPSLSLNYILSDNVNYCLNL